MAKYSLTVPEAIKVMESRFQVVTSLAGDLERYPVKKEDQLDFATDREKSRNFAEVFTPIYMVDQMLSTVPGKSGIKNTLDLCSGHGQFSIRILRKAITENKKFDLKKYLTNHHYFNEIQLESCWKLLWVFGNKINLAIGSALKMNTLPNNWKGIWLYIESIDSWVNITNLAKSFHPYSGFKGFKKLETYPKVLEDRFVKAVQYLSDKFNKIAEEYKMEIKQILSTPDGRKNFLNIISEAASGVEENWQDKATPDWVCREMVNCIPGGVEGLKRILVLFNAEFLEVLVKEKRIDPRNINFGYDSEVEGLFGKRAYGVNTFSVGKNFKQLCEALEGKSGQYDVVFSNPPYQIEDGGYGKSAKAIYHEIVMYTIDYLDPKYVCMITPSRWMVGGKGLNDYRARMISDRRIRMIQDFPGNSEIFKTVAIAGGISYFLWDKNHNGTCEFNGVNRYLDEFDIVVRDNTSISILKKVLKRHKGPFCNDRVLPQKPFGLRTFFKDWVPEGTEGAVKCYCPVKEGFERWISPGNYVDNHGVINKHNVLTSAVSYEGAAFKGGERRIFTKLFVADKSSICLETYIVVGSFNTKKEATNYAEYMRTRFYRFILFLRMISQHINKQKFAWVPDFEDYTVQYTDKDLYEHFGLTKREIDHIESTIKSLD